MKWTYCGAAAGARGVYYFWIHGVCGANAPEEEQEFEKRWERDRFLTIWKKKNLHYFINVIAFLSYKCIFEKKETIPFNWYLIRKQNSTVVTSNHWWIRQLCGAFTVIFRLSSKAEPFSNLSLDLTLRRKVSTLYFIDRAVGPRSLASPRNPQQEWNPQVRTP